MHNFVAIAKETAVIHLYFISVFVFSMTSARRWRLYLFIYGC